MAGIYPGAGITIGPAIVSAYLAVEDAKAAAEGTEITRAYK
jgi:hypothetical protein